MVLVGVSGSRGNESVLEHLTAEWNAIEVQTAWKLEPVLCYKDSDSSASDDQPMAATTPLSNPARPENGKPNGASPDVAPEEGVVQFKKTQQLTMPKDPTAVMLKQPRQKPHLPLPHLLLF